jgi:hypothetical protein
LPTGGWNGAEIAQTKSCEDCVFRREAVGDADIVFMVCVWGVAWKRLGTELPKRGCSKLKLHRPENHWNWVKGKWAQSEQNLPKPEGKPIEESWLWTRDF